MALPGEVIRCGHRALAVAHRAIGREELYRLGAAATGQGDGAAAQHIGEQVGQRTVGAHGHALAIDVVVFGGGDGAPTEHRLGIAIKGDGVSDASGVHPLQHAVAFVVVAHQRARRTAAAGMPTGRVDVATGHVAHGIVTSIGVRHAAQAGRRVHMIDVAIAYVACRTARHAIQAVIVLEPLMEG